MDLAKLKMLTELKYQKNLLGMADILHKEAVLRDKISRLREQAYEAQSLPADKTHMHNIGADVIWFKWVAKNIRILNIELANLLVQKEVMLAGQRHALGQRSVAQRIYDDEQKKRRENIQAASLKKAIDVSAIRLKRTE